MVHWDIRAAHQLRDLRVARGISQRALAEAAEVSRVYISRLETARTTLVARGGVERLARTLGVTVAELVEGREPDMV